MILPHEEIHVIKLDGVGAVAGCKVAEDVGGSRWTLHPFTIAIGGMNATETAAKGAADTSVMNCSSATKVRRAQVSVDRYAVEWGPGK
jgi:hypothetical protein